MPLPGLYLPTSRLDAWIPASTLLCKHLSFTHRSWKQVLFCKLQHNGFGTVQNDYFLTPTTLIEQAYIYTSRKDCLPQLQGWI
jgi:hypothetical protein